MMSLRALLAAACVTLAALPGQAVASCSRGACSPSGLSSRTTTAQEVVDKLSMAPNVEGGYYVETFRDELLLPGSNRSVSTAIYYLLEGPNVPSVWHRVDAVEIWHWYAGAPLILELSNNDGTPTRSHVLGQDIFGDQQPQIVIAADEWQRATSCGNWTLVGTTVAPAFVPEGYELAPDGWEPNDGA
ncbi:RmlC-like cupin domain-containing protein [Xylaria bambusicola]|uniref:RmlC-like cupin domain-containing protein n=1 Tax=Xylaria bambusicola TaxID=326684 RepID=UPI0020073350|nr:RmlC-like cupin domain-containing protein [Xylaria bambusicola]KAI0506551.1 RmlC-like cupin domain-containing protein [Xylaria bambusicola]